MLIGDGYAHSLKGLLDANRAEQERAARRAERAQSVHALVVRIIEWGARYGTWLGLSGRRRPEST